MTLEEMKRKVLALIEELNPLSVYLTDDPDIQAKINYVINQIQFELARFKKIPARETMIVTAGQEIETADLDDFYQLKIVRGVKSEVIENVIIFNEDGTADIWYYKYPKRITHETENDYKFELSNDVLEVLPYGVAADLLKSDVSAQYGQIYANRYKEMKQELDFRTSMGSVVIEGGVEV